MPEAESSSSPRRKDQRRGRASIEALEARRLLTAYFVDGVGGDGLADGGSDSNAGTTIDVPFKTIQRALNLVRAGDTVSIRGGIYREKLIVKPNHHGAAGVYVTLQNYAQETPDIRGSEEVGGWVAHSTNSYGTIWKKTGWGYNSQQVFDDGIPLQQIGKTGYAYPNDRLVGKGTNLTAMIPGRFWMETATSTLYVQLLDKTDPNNSFMEASTGINYVDYGRTFMAEAGRGYMRLVGLTIQHSNTSEFAEQGAMVNLGSNSIAENCTFKYADFAGVNLGYLTDNVKLINCQVINNGDSGVNVAGTTNFVISGCTITANNYRGFSAYWHAGGIKLASNSSLGKFPHGVIENNEVAGNTGPGIWFDYCFGPTGSVIRGNYVHDNTTEGIFYEYSANVEIYNNIVVDNTQRGIYLTNSSNVKVYNNTLITKARGSMGLAVDKRNANEICFDVEIRNNIFSAQRFWTAMYIWGADGAHNITSDNNIFHTTLANQMQRFSLYLDNASGSTIEHRYDTFAAWQNAGAFTDGMTGQTFGPFDDHSASGNPNFIVGAGDDYRLGAGSAAIDAGVTLTQVATDYAGSARPTGAGYDIGAFELETVPPTATIPPVPSEPDVNAVTITFSEPVSGFDLSDLTLRRNGGPNLLTASQTLSTTDNVTFTLGNLAGLTALAGAYELAITGAVTDLAGNGLANAPTQGWLVSSAIAGRSVFYNRSYFDGNSAAANASDDAAIASDKQALLPGQTATFANYTSYSRGINGVMVDVARLSATSLSAGDFEFRVGNSTTPGTWAVAPAPLSISIRPGAGADGSARVTIVWADNAIAKQWLRVTVKANANTGLEAPDVFYFGNAIGETGNNAANAFVDGSDFIGVRDNPHNFLSRALIDDVYDINRDSLVNGTDLVLVRDNNTNFITALKLLAAPAGTAEQLQATQTTRIAAPLANVWLADRRLAERLLGAQTRSVLA